MWPSSKGLEIDARWLYRRTFLLFFLVFQFIAWHRAGRFPGRPLAIRLMVFLFAPWATIHSFVIALLAGGVLTLLAVLLVRLFVRPLFYLWLSPPVDSSWGLFHVSPGETILASVSARRRSGWGWRPGVLSITNRRLWFFPAACEDEPWSLGLDEMEHVEQEGSALAELAVIRNWPLPLHLRGRSGQDAVIATSNPEAVLAWFGHPMLRSTTPRRSPAFEQEHSMSERFNVLIADFLDETSIESAVLGDIARIEMAKAREEAELGPYLPNADAILLFHDISIVGAASFARAPRCRGVVRAGVGYNNIDVDAATRHGVVVCNVPDYGTEEVADHAIMFLLALVRRLVKSHQAIRAGNWDYRSVLGAPRLRGKTFGVVGCGRIGTATAIRAQALGLDVVFFDPFLRQGMDKALGIRRVYSLEELLEQSHFVSLHCYLDDTTRHLLNPRTFARMRPGAILINTARGPLVDEHALVDALESGHLAAAGLDVVEREPLENERLRSHPNVLLTPHTAFYSVEGYIELRTKTAEEARRILLGEPPRNALNRPSGRVS